MLGESCGNKKNIQTHLSEVELPQKLHQHAWQHGPQSAVSESSRNHRAKQIVNVVRTRVHKRCTKNTARHEHQTNCEKVAARDLDDVRGDANNNTTKTATELRKINVDDLDWVSAFA